MTVAPETPVAILRHPTRERFERHRPRRGLALLLVIVAGLLSFALSVEINAARAVAAARGDADMALAQARYPAALALYAAVASRNGPLYAFAGDAPTLAATGADQARVAWATALAASGNPDGALRILAGSTSSEGNRERAVILLGAARQATSAHHPLIALDRLDQFDASSPPPDLAQQAAGLRPGYEVTAAIALVADNRAPDALTLLDGVIAADAVGTASDDARALLPETLLAAGEAAVTAESYIEASGYLTRLTTTFPASQSAATARAMLAAPQLVVGTLSAHDGHPISASVRLSSHFTRVGSSYETSWPFYYGTSDASGNFSFADVPVGGPYVVEVQTADGWTTLIDPATGRPANTVTVTSLTPADIGYIIIPS